MASRRLPPLYPLRAFEAAARLSSFTLAAEELSISQSAVSHQVKTLEAYFGVQLFHRARGFIRLTAEGMRLFAACESAFNQLAQVNEILPEHDIEATLTLCSPPLFFNWWLLPRLGRFAREYPKVHFRFIHFSRGMRLTPNDVDVAIIWGDRIWDGFSGARMLDMAYSPVASPRLAAALPKEFSPAVLEQTVLLHAFDHQGWTSWLAAAGFPGVPATSGWVFQEPGMMMEAVASGQGIALGPFPVMDAAVEAGRYVRVFGGSVHPSTYFLGISNRSAEKPVVRLLWKWFSENVLPASAS
jgi:LysR family glycine cleavage system transcriptional activator